MYDPEIFKEADYDFGPVKKKRNIAGVTKNRLWELLHKHGWKTAPFEDPPVDKVGEELGMSPEDVVKILIYFLNTATKVSRPITAEMVDKRIEKRKMNWGINYKSEGLKIVRIEGNNYKPTGKKGVRQKK